MLGVTFIKKWRVADLSDMIEDRSGRGERYGLDFGFTHSRNACIRFKLCKAKREIYVLEEHYARNESDDDLAEAITPIVGGNTVWCDSAEPKSIAALRGYDINARAVAKGRDSVKHGIRWLRKWTIVIHKGCQNFKNELSSWQWKKDKSGESIEAPVEVNDHGPSAMRYAFERDMGHYQKPHMVIGGDGKEGDSENVGSVHFAVGG